MAVVLNNQQSTYGSPTAYYTVTLTPSNRTSNSVTINCSVSARLATTQSSMGYGVICGIYIGGSWHNFTLVASGTTWSGTSPISASTTFTVSGLSSSQTSITGIEFQAVSGAPEMGAGLSATSCSNLEISSYSGEGGDSGGSCTIYIQEGAHTNLTVYSLLDGQKTYLSNGDKVYFDASNEASIVATYSVDDGYEIETHTMNGVSFSSGASWPLSSGSMTFKTTAVADGSGGGGSGDSGGGYSGSCTIRIQAGAHTYISVASIINGDVNFVQNGSVISLTSDDVAKIQAFYSVDDGYEIETHTMNGVSFSDGQTWTITESEMIFVTTAVQSDSGGSSSGTLIKSGTKTFTDTQTGNCLKCDVVWSYYDNGYFSYDYYVYRKDWTSGTDISWSSPDGSGSAASYSSRVYVSSGGQYVSVNSSGVMTSSVGPFSASFISASAGERSFYNKYISGLQLIGDSSGDEGGGSIGDCQIMFVTDDHVTTRAFIGETELFSTNYINYDKNNPVEVQIFFEVEDGYEIDKHILRQLTSSGYLNDITFESGDVWVFDNDDVEQFIIMTTTKVPAVNVYTLSIEAESGSTITVNRENSLYGNVGVVNNGGEIYKNDVLVITSSLSDGCYFYKKTINGLSFASGDSIVVDGDISIITETVSSNAEGISFINNNGHYSTYVCQIDNGISWDFYAPYVTVETRTVLDGIFKGIVNYTGSNYLPIYKENNSSSTQLTRIINGTEIMIKDIAIGNDGFSVWVKTTISSVTGWCNAYHLDFEILCRVINESGTLLYSGSSDSSNILVDINNNFELEVTKLVADGYGTIFGYTSVKDLNDNVINGYVKMTDVEMALLENVSIEWVKLGV